MKSVDELGEETDIERVFVANSGRTDLTGLQVGDYIVDGLLKDGVYSQIFHGLNVLNGESVAIKRPAPQLTLAAQQSYSSLETGVFLTGAYAQTVSFLPSWRVYHPTLTQT